MTLQATETLQPGPFQGIFDDAGNFVGFLNPRANGTDLRIGGDQPGPATFTTVTASVIKAPAGGNVSIQNDAGLQIGLFNGTTGLFTAPFNMFFGGYIEGLETTAPAAPVADRGRIYFQDNGAGKTQLMVLFSSGAAQQIAIQP